MAELRVTIDGTYPAGTPIPVAATTGGSSGTPTFVEITDGTNTAGVTVANALKVDASAAGVGAVNQGTPGSTANAWPIKVTDGTSTAGVAGGAGGPAGLVVVDGFVNPVTTLAAVTANTTGTTVDGGSAFSNWSAVAVAGSAPTAGTLTLELSLDGTTFVSSSVTASVTAAGNFLLASTGRSARYGRVSLTNLAGTITLTVKMMASG